MTAGDENERLRRAFARSVEPRTSTGPCPDAEELWRAARGELPAGRKRVVLDHLLECDACAESCAIASDLVEEAPGEPSVMPQSRPTASPFRWAWIAVPAAAMIIVGLVWLRPYDRFGATPVEEFRELGGVRISSTLDESVPLARDACELRWSAGPAGTLYTVVVSTEDLDVLARADELRTPRFVVPPSALENVASGETFLWRVEAILPDTTPVVSPVFRARLE